MENQDLDRKEILNGLIEVLKTVRTIDPARLEGITEVMTDMDTPSTELINIAAKVEQKFGIEFEDEDIDELGSKVKDIINLIIKAKERANS